MDGDLCSGLLADPAALARSHRRDSRRPETGARTEPLEYPAAEQGAGTAPATPTRNGCFGARRAGGRATRWKEPQVPRDASR